MRASTPAVAAASATTAFFLGLGLAVGLANAFLVGLTTTVVIAALVVITDDLGETARVSVCGEAEAVVGPAASPPGTDHAERPLRTLASFINASSPHRVDLEKVCPGCGRTVTARRRQPVTCAVCHTECPPLLAGPWPDVLGPSGSQQPLARSERVPEES